MQRKLSIALIAAVVSFVVHAIGNPHYGFFRDELYFIMCGRHPDWGYVDQPPIAPLLAAWSQAFGPSLVALRLVPAFFAAASVYATCLLAIELGGGAFAQVLAAAAALLTPVLMAFGAAVSPDMVGLWLWPLVALLVLRIASGASPRLWLGAGVALGFCLQSKYSVLYFAAALIVGLLLTPQRRVLLSWWFVGGAALALAIALPNFLWQSAHGFPILELLRNGQNGKNVIVSPLEFIGQQFIITNPFLSIVWIAGLFWLLRVSATRFLGYTYVVLMAMMIASHAKHYYPADVYPILIAAGGAAIERWTERVRALRSVVTALVVAGGSIFIPFVLPVMSEERYLSYSSSVNRALGISRESTQTEHKQLGALPQEYADMHGWPELAETIARVYDSLPPADRAKAVAFAQNYGEASAIEFFEPHVPVVSGHNQYWLWGTRGFDGSVVIDINGTCGAHDHLFRSAVRATTFSAPYVMPYEDKMPIMVCRGLRVPLSKLWPDVKHYD